MIQGRPRKRGVRSFKRRKKYESRIFKGIPRVAVTDLQKQRRSGLVADMRSGARSISSGQAGDGETNLSEAPFGILEHRELLDDNGFAPLERGAPFNPCGSRASRLTV